MTNLFDTSTAKTGEPSEIIAGDYVAWWRKDLSTDYPPAQYSLSYECIAEGTPARKITITAADSGGDYLIEIPSATTLAYTVANYHWTAQITRLSDSARVTVDNGIFIVQPDKKTNTNDPRSLPLKMLGYIETALLHRASNSQLDVLAYSLGVESSATRDPAQLMKWREYWQKELIKQNRKARARKGRSHSGQIKVQF